MKNPPCAREKQFWTVPLNSALCFGRAAFSPWQNGDGQSLNKKTFKNNLPIFREKVIKYTWQTPWAGIPRQSDEGTFWSPPKSAQRGALKEPLFQRRWGNLSVCFPLLPRKSSTSLSRSSLTLGNAEQLQGFACESVLAGVVKTRAAGLRSS